MGKWTIETVATLQKDGLNGSYNGNYAIPHGVALGIVNRSLWAAGGTADIYTVKPDDDDSGVIENTSQMIFAFNTAAKTNGTLYRKDDDDNGWVSVTSNDANAVLESGKNGWYIELDGANPMSMYDSEYVSAKPLVVDGILYIATFKPAKVNKEGASDPCGRPDFHGVSRLYAVNIATAKGTWKNGEKTVEFNDIRITGLTHSKLGKRESIVVTFDSLTDEGSNLETTIGGQDDMGISDLSEAQKWFYKSLPPKSTLGPNDGKGVINYWLEQ